MKTITLLIITILFLNLVYASCDNINIEELYLETNVSCENLNTIRITDPTCDPFPPPGNCWDGYSKAEIVLPQKISIIDPQISLEKELNSAYSSSDWTFVECSEPGYYQVIVVFDDTCEKTLTLNLREEEPETNDNNQDDDSDRDSKRSKRSSSSDAGGTVVPNVAPYVADVPTDQVQDVIPVATISDDGQEDAPTIKSQALSSRKKGVNLRQILIIVLLLVLVSVIVSFFVAFAAHKK